MKKIEATEFVKGQLPDEVLDNLDHIVSTALINFNNGEQGFYGFSKIVRIPNVYDLKTPVVAVTEDNKKHLETSYISRQEGEIAYLKRWFPSDAPVEREIGHHIDVIMYSADQLEKEGDPIKSEWGVVAVNVEPENGTPITPETMINNHLGVSFGGNAVKLDRDKYFEAVEFWNAHAKQERA